jgi:hypothetical protein
MADLWFHVTKPKNSRVKIYILLESKMLLLPLLEEISKAKMAKSGQFIKIGIKKGKLLDLMNKEVAVDAGHLAAPQPSKVLQSSTK